MILLINYLALQHAREVYAQKTNLATHLEELQFRVLTVLNEGGRSIGVLDEVLASYLILLTNFD